MSASAWLARDRRWPWPSPATSPRARLRLLPARPALRQPGLPAGGGDIDAVDPDLVLTLRAGMQVSPSYLGSDDYELGPDLAARLDYVRFPNGFDFGSGRTVGFRTGWGLRGSARYLGERESDEHDEIEGLDDVAWSFEARPRRRLRAAQLAGLHRRALRRHRPQRLGRRGRRRRASPIRSTG